MNYSKFTPEFKDSILKILCEQFTPYRVQGFKPVKWFDSQEELVMLETALYQFQERGFIANLSYQKIQCFLSLTADAVDFLRKGGFTFEETVLIQQLDKAILELEKLQSESGLKKYIDRIKGIAGTLSSLATTYTAIKGGE